VKQFQSEHGIGDPVIAQTLPAKVVAVTFTADVVLYEVAFDSGGAHATVEPSEVKPCAR
jgi:hypothetical protein